VEGAADDRARAVAVSVAQPRRKNTSGWATGFILFAGLMMIMVGIWQALQA
jgi:hypothetical protein